MAWLTIWNTAEMSAWLAIMAASVATTNMGQKVPLGSDFQNMASKASGCASRYEPCTTGVALRMLHHWNPSLLHNENPYSAESMTPSGG